MIEGVMMKGPKHYSISVRKKNGKIKTKIESLKKRKFKPFRWPIFRGFINLIDMLVLGLKSLQWSANQIEDIKEEMNWKEYLLLIITSVGFAIGLFILLPLLLTNYLIISKGILFNIVDGLFRIIIFVTYRNEFFTPGLSRVRADDFQGREIKSNSI